MTQSERICRTMIARGTWTKISCILYRKIHKDKCSILEEMEDNRLGSGQPEHPDNI